MRGQIIEKSKGVFLVRIETRKNGKRETLFSRTVRGKKTDADKLLTQKKAELDKGVLVKDEKLTLNEYLDKWIKIIKPRVTEQTFNSYETMLRVYIRPHIGEFKLSDIKIMTVQKVYSEMQEKGFAPRTIRYAHAVFSMALSKAVEWGNIVVNPCDYAELPRLSRKETKAFSPEQAKQFLEFAKDNRHGLIFEFALATGMRPEEYLGLKWTDINFERCTATVQRAVVWIKGSGYKFTETKTAKSRRTIPLPKSILPKLREHKRKQTEHRFELGSHYENHNLVFANEIGRPHHYRNLTQRHYEKILKKAELDKLGFVLYSLRHSCATLLLSAGENPKVVAERLGHSSVKMTLDTYSHVLPDMQQSATDKLETMLYQKIS